MTVEYAQFSAKLVVGDFGKALVSLSEQPTNQDGESIDKESLDLVKQDLEVIGVEEWFEYLSLNDSELASGTVYELTGSASFDLDTCNYTDLKLNPLAKIQDALK